MKRILLAVFLILAPAAAFCQTGSSVATSPAATPSTVAQQVSAPATPIVIMQPSGNATVSFGTLGAQLLEWFGAVFIPVIGTFVTRWLIALARKAGVEASQAMSDKLDGIIENGLHAAAANASADLKGTLNVDVKSKIISQAVNYAQDHAAETIKGLGGLDPSDPTVVEALRARANKALNNLAPPAVA